MTMHNNHVVDVPRPTGETFGGSLRHARRRALDVARAFDILGEPYTSRFVMEDGTPVPPDQITEQESAELSADLQYLSRSDPPAVDVLLEQLYAASSHSDRSRVAPALDRLLAYVDHWSALSPKRVDALFEQLEPSRLLRAVGQTLLAATRLDAHLSHARQLFLVRFMDDLRARGTPEATIRRLAEGLGT